MPPEPPELAAIVPPTPMVGMTFRVPYKGDPDAEGAPPLGISQIKLGKTGPTMRCLVERDGDVFQFTVLPDVEEE